MVKKSIKTYLSTVISMVIRVPILLTFIATCVLLMYSTRSYLHLLELHHELARYGVLIEWKFWRDIILAIILFCYLPVVIILTSIGKMLKLEMKVGVSLKYFVLTLLFLVFSYWLSIFFGNTLYGLKGLL